MAAAKSNKMILIVGAVVVVVGGVAAAMMMSGGESDQPVATPTRPAVAERSKSIDEEGAAEVTREAVAGAFDEQVRRTEDADEPAVDGTTSGQVDEPKARKKTKKTERRKRRRPKRVIEEEEEPEEDARRKKKKSKPRKAW